MRNYKLANANAHKISVTTTATSLKDLIDTAASTSNTLPNEVNAVDLVAEGGEFRYLQDNVPTASVGILVAKDQSIFLRNVNLSTLYLIASSTTTVDVSVGVSDEGEVSN